MRRFFNILTGGLIVLLIWPSSTFSQFDELGLTISPAILEISGQPGTTSTVQITVQNDSTDAIGVTISSRSVLPNDAEIDQSKRYLYDASTWIVPVQKDLLLVPGQQAATDIQVIVPPDASPGGHYALVTYSPVLAAEPTEGTNTVRSQPEVTSLALITVPGDIEERGYAEVSSGSGVKLNSQIKTAAKFFNDGNVHILPSVSATVFRADGSPHENIQVLPQLSLPNTAKTIETSWEPDGAFGRFYVEYDFKFGTPSQTTTVRTNTFLVLPSPANILFIASVGTFALLGLRFGLRKITRRVRKKGVYVGKARSQTKRSKPIDGVEPGILDRIIQDSNLQDNPKRRKISPPKPQPKPPHKPPHKKKPKKIKVK